MLAAGLRHLWRSSAVEAWHCRSLEVHALQGPLRLARDGEAFDGPATFSIEKGSPLDVFLP